MGCKSRNVDVEQGLAFVFAEVRYCMQKHIFADGGEGCTQDFSLVLFGLLMKLVVVVMESPSNHTGM